MGQAFRRASGKIKVPTDPSVKGVGERRPPSDRVDISRTTTQFNNNDSNQDNLGSSDNSQKVNTANILEERDPQYDAMLSQMVGRIRPKAGGKLETGEASVVQRYERPLPKLRNTKIDSGSYEEKPSAPGTLNVAQLRHIMLLHEGKADDHNGPMDVQRIAEKFRLDVAQVQMILQFMSMPPEDNNKKKSFP